MNKDLVKEAAAVGLGAIPIFLGTSAILDAMAPEGSALRSPAMKTFVGGMVFHLAADAAGWNQWYLDHSVRARQNMAQEYSYTMNWYTNHNGYSSSRYSPYY